MTAAGRKRFLEYLGALEQVVKDAARMTAQPKTMKELKLTEA
jgi:hypothetical protein